MIHRILTGLMVAISSFTFSQSLFDSIRWEHQMSLLKKKSIILQQLQLTESQKASFWPIYEAYERAMEFIECEYSFLLWEYAHEFKSLNEKEQHELSAQLMEDELLIARTRKMYFKKLSKALFPEQVIAFMRLDQDDRSAFRSRLINGDGIMIVTAALPN